MAVDKQTSIKLSRKSQTTFRALLRLFVDPEWILQLDQARQQQPACDLDFKLLTQQLLLVGQANLATAMGAPHVAVGLYDRARVALSASPTSASVFSRPADLLRPTPESPERCREKSCSAVTLPHVRAALSAPVACWPPEDSTVGTVTHVVHRGAWHVRYFYTHVDRVVDYSSACISRRVRSSLSTLWPRLLALSRTLGMGASAAATLQLVCVLLLYTVFTAVYATFVLCMVLIYLYAIGSGIYWLFLKPGPVESSAQRAWVPPKWAAVLQTVGVGAMALMAAYCTSIMVFRNRFLFLGAWQLVARGFAPRVPLGPSAPVTTEPGVDKQARVGGASSKGLLPGSMPPVGSSSATAGAMPCSSLQLGQLPQQQGQAEAPGHAAWKRVMQALKPLPSSVAQALLLTVRWEALVMLSAKELLAAGKCCDEAMRLQRLHQICPLPKAAMTPSWHMQRQPCGFIGQGAVSGNPLGSEREPGTCQEVLQSAGAAIPIASRTTHASQMISQQQAQALHQALCIGLVQCDTKAERAMSDSDCAFRDRAETKSLDFLLTPQWRNWLKEESSYEYGGNAGCVVVWEGGAWYGWWFGLTVARWVADQCNVKLSLALRITIAVSVQGFEMTHLESLMAAVDSAGGNFSAVGLREGPLLEHMLPPSTTPASGTFLRHIMRWLIPPGPNDPEWMRPFHKRACLRLRKHGLLPLFPPNADAELDSGAVFYCMQTDQLLQSHKLCELPQNSLPSALQAQPRGVNLQQRHMEAFAARVLGVASDPEVVSAFGDAMPDYIVVHRRGGAVVGAISPAAAARDLLVLVPMSHSDASPCGLHVLLRERRLQHVWERWGVSNATSAAAACLQQLRFARTAGSTESGSNMAESTSAFDWVSHTVDAAQVHGTSLRRTVSRTLLKQPGSVWGTLNRTCLELHTSAAATRLGGFAVREQTTPPRELLHSPGMPQALFPTDAFGKAVRAFIGRRQHGSESAALVRRYSALHPRQREVLHWMGQACLQGKESQRGWGVDAACQHPVLGHGWELTPPNSSPSAACMPHPGWEAFVPVACPPLIAAPFQPLLTHPWADLYTRRPSVGEAGRTDWPVPLSACAGVNDADALTRWVAPVLLGRNTPQVQSREVRSMCVRLTASTMAYCLQDSLGCARAAATRQGVTAVRVCGPRQQRTEHQTPHTSPSWDIVDSCLFDPVFLQRHHVALRRLLGMPWRGWGPFMAEFLLAHGTRQLRTAQQFPQWQPPAYTPKIMKVSPGSEASTCLHQRSASTSIPTQQAMRRLRPSAMLRAQQNAAQIKANNKQPGTTSLSMLRMLLPSFPQSSLPAGSAKGTQPTTVLLNRLAACGKALRAAIAAGARDTLVVGGWVDAGHNVPDAALESQVGVNTHWTAAVAASTRDAVPHDNQDAHEELQEIDNIESGHTSGLLSEYTSPWMSTAAGGAGRLDAPSTTRGPTSVHIQPGGIVFLRLQEAQWFTALPPPASVRARPAGAADAADAWLRTAAAAPVQQALQESEAGVSLYHLLLLDTIDQDVLMDVSRCRNAVLQQLRSGIPEDALAVLPQVPLMHSWHP